MLNNYFSIVDRRFSNQKSCAVNVVRIRCEPVRHFLESVKSVFRTIDFADEYQAQLGRLLWKLRCAVLFALAPYDHEELRLAVLGDEISGMAERLPGSRESVSILVQKLSSLLEQKENPKLEWVLRQDWSGGESAAVFALMAMKQSFGADLVGSNSDNEKCNLGVITSLEQLGNEKYFSLVMPGTLQYLSHSLFMKLFHRGEFRRFHILLYEGESLSLKSRLQLPGSSLFPDLSDGAGLNIEKIDSPDVSHDPSTDDGMPAPAQIFGISGVTVRGQSAECPSRFLLCEDGTGFYVAESKRIRVWRPDARERLAFVFPVQLLEGDFVILEKGQRCELLDQSGSDTGFLVGLDATGVWRGPLRSILLSSSSEEVASLMLASGYLNERSTGLVLPNAIEISGDVSIGKAESYSSNAARNLQASISKWAEGQVYGPGDLNHLMALVQVLVDSGYLQIGSSPECAARQWFKDLEKLRAGRRVAGMNLSDRIDQLLEDSLDAQAVPKEGLELLLDNGMLVSVHQLAMISDQVSAIPESLLKKTL